MPSQCESPPTTARTVDFNLFQVVVVLACRREGAPGLVETARARGEPPAHFPTANTLTTHILDSRRRSRISASYTVSSTGLSDKVALDTNLSQPGAGQFLFPRVGKREPQFWQLSSK